jgi:hypothetical protein
MNERRLSGVPMSDDPPVIISSTEPFKVQATTSKMGGVDALAKRPLDMSGQPSATQEHRESVPADMPPQEARLALPPESPVAQSWVMVPDDTHGGLGGEGPVLQEQIDTSHREFFDDPSRYIRTNVKVKLPGMADLRGDSEAVPAQSGEADVLSAHADGLTDVSRPRNARVSVGDKRLSRRASSTPVATRLRNSGSPEQRRDQFNQRLATIMSRQQEIREELSAVEQAVQSNRAMRDSKTEDDTGHES